MRLATFVLLLVLPVAACSEPDTRIDPAQVNWMEWPAEVLAATPFTVRLVGTGGPACGPEDVRLVTAPTVDASAVTFEPYFLSRGEVFACRLDAQSSPGANRLLRPAFDTRAPVPGLEAAFPRTYEIRAGTDVLLRGLARFPIRTFGDISVLSEGVPANRVNAGGLVTASRDTQGCVTLRPYAFYQSYVIENPPADTATYWSAFVRGYLYDAAAPVCGETKVFHLVTIN
jgi:hypothetical protein